MRGRVHLVGIAGIPGVGKSTAILELNRTGILADLLHPHRVVYVMERSDEWRASGKLDRFYAKPERRALSFQLSVFYSHVESVEQAIRDHATFDGHLFIVVERTVWDQYVFWSVQPQDEDDDDAYMPTWHMHSVRIPLTELVFFCKTSDMQKTMQRVHNRGRREELRASVEPTTASGPIESAGGLTLEYQTALYKRHEEVFTEPYLTAPFAYNHPVPRVVHVSADLPYHEQMDALRALAATLAGPMLALLE